MTGIAQAQGADAGEPQIVWGSVVDYYSASLLAMAICAALFQRERTGVGQKIDASLLRSALAMQSGRMVWAHGEDRNVDRDLRAGRCNGIHPTREGYIYLQATTPQFWTSLCELVGLPQLATDPRYDTISKRKERDGEILPLLRDALMQRTAREWETLFGNRVPCTVVRGIEEMFDHEQVLAEGLVATYESPTVGRYRAMSGPIRMNEGRGDTPDRRPPLIGEHSDAILDEHGFSTEEIAALRAVGAVR